jgi:hypothetical protein
MKRPDDTVVPAAPADEPEPFNDFESLKVLSGANAGNGFQWDPFVMVVVYALLRLVGVVLLPFRSRPPQLDVLPVRNTRVDVAPRGDVALVGVDLVDGSAPRPPGIGADADVAPTDARED